MSNSDFNYLYKRSGALILAPVGDKKGPSLLLAGAFCCNILLYLLIR